ncbi:hypothetical protein ND748_05205 [Frankia sp. AiPs1]|uniref:hypothetical protein n=1 Tax=Frankia sp. AiPs1 TaxID=573493 RepID=UPI002043665E|nr:hypothetical protein [Frankia sp. AiPs1]MCM3921076.1 hypothetical protein [Frankia sp. AiPs1]
MVLFIVIMEKPVVVVVVVPLIVAVTDSHARTVAENDQRGTVAGAISLQPAATRINPER